MAQPIPRNTPPTDTILGSASQIIALRAQIERLASFDAPGNPHVPTVLLLGETGTGKGLVARVMHESGPRAGGPYVDVNCAAIPEGMLEAELFGFEAGAFTDAKRAKLGLFEAAVGGTLLLDEVDALPLALQGKLLTAIETKRVRRLGAVAERALDVKLIAATNTVLEQRIATGHFRADLYHRLAVVVLSLPPLRERGEDVLLLAGRLLQQYTTAHGVPPKRLSAEAEVWLQGYAWSGNIRELSHVMERVTLLHVGPEVDAETLAKLCLPLAAPEPPAGSATLPVAPAFQGALPPEAEEIRQALVQTGGNVVRAARLLGVSRDTVRHRMQRYGIARPQPELMSPPAPLLALAAGIPDSPLRDGQEGQVSAEPADAPTSPRRPRRRERPPSGATGPPRVRDDRMITPNIPSLEPAWEQKPVAVLALELTWPETASPEALHYDPWTERARWEQAIVDKVQGFGGVLLQRSPALLTWVFGLPQTPEQLPQRRFQS